MSVTVLDAIALLVVLLVLMVVLRRVLVIDGSGCVANKISSSLFFDSDKYKNEKQSFKNMNTNWSPITPHNKKKKKISNEIKFEFTNEKQI